MSKKQPKSSPLGKKDSFTRTFEGGPKQDVPVRPGFPKVKKDGTRKRPNMPT